MALTAKQQRFVEEYVIDFNGTRAAIRAGYSEDSAALIASQNIRKLHIRRAIEAEKRILAEKADVTAEWVAKRLKAEALLFGDDATHPARIKALELLGKITNAFPPEELKHKHGGDKDNQTPISFVEVPYDRDDTSEETASPGPADPTP